jgi:hypothetical protein
MMLQRLEAWEFESQEQAAGTTECHVSVLSFLPHVPAVSSLHSPRLRVAKRACQDAEVWAPCQNRHSGE